MSIFDLFKQLEKEKTVSAPVSWIVCCLGNPSPKYDGTRHNAGFMAADVLEKKLNFRIDRIRFEALTGEVTYGGQRLLVMKPQTYMNESGRAAGAALAWYKLPPERLIVVCDDLEQAPGRLRVRPKGSAGGHNGIKSIIAHAGTEVFPRVRVGIGRPTVQEYSVVDWVLGKFTPEERKKVEAAAVCAADAVLAVAEKGVPEAMNRYNGFSAD